jgi:small-conductance mechanosensitive channel
VPVDHLLVGGVLTGVVVGIAAQQVLGNVFAGAVLLLARPFGVGDHIRVRSGALGGQFDGVVTGMNLTYVTLRTDEGPLHVPNSGMLAAAVGPWKRAAVNPRPDAASSDHGSKTPPAACGAKTTPR